VNSGDKTACCRVCVELLTLEWVKKNCQLALIYMVLPQHTTACLIDAPPPLSSLPLWARLIYTVWRFVIDSLSFYIYGHVVSFITILLFGVLSHIPLRYSVAQDARNKEQIKPPDQLNLCLTNFRSVEQTQQASVDVYLTLVLQARTYLCPTHP